MSDRWRRHECADHYVKGCDVTRTRRCPGDVDRQEAGTIGRDTAGIEPITARGAPDSLSQLVFERFEANGTHARSSSYQRLVSQMRRRQKPKVVVSALSEARTRASSWATTTLHCCGFGGKAA